ncbi:MAG: NAD(P)/FAD-dependent oxidoreductase [Nitrospirae bacterium]|nr:NAD(P)/FAD-dependent oxidoreductase [Nitrospirota bacterium]
MKQKLTIIGGGITGLAVAYLAAKDGWDVTVLEGSEQIGGLMRTFQIAGNRLEHYYHHFFTNDAELVWLLRELDIADKLEFRKTTIGIFRNNSIYDFNTPMDLLKFKPMKMMDKIRFILSSIYLGKLADWKKWENVSALDWFYKYAGRSATDSVWKPLLEIKFGPYANKVPTAWMVGRLKQRMNSRQGTKEHLGYIKGSLQTLIDSLSKSLSAMGVKIILNARVERLLIKQNTLYGAETAKGVFNGGFFLATLPATHLVPLLRDNASDYAKELSRIEYSGAVCTILEMDRPFSNIYWLNVADPGFPFGGVIEHTNFISPDEYNGSHIIYLSRYFAQTDHIASASKKDILDQMIPSLKRINPQFKESWVKNNYVFRTNTAATVCGLNFSDAVPGCKTPISNLYIVNMSHIYPDERSCNNAIRIAAQACKKMGIDSSMVPFRSSLSGQIGMD